MSAQEPIVVSELVADMEDWSLQAIVRGSSGDYGKMVNMDMDGTSSFFDSTATAHHQQSFDQDLLAGFPEIFEVSTGSSDELEELYKSFYPATCSLPAQTVVEFEGQKNIADDKPAHDQSDQSPAVCTPKYKRRKNQQKRVVIQVSADGLSSDMWAWRKYGQKPIKGSPYPRSYYRCSSSKGCLARKQVEQSCTDAGKFIITYAAEHSHSKPTRRNSLAGTVRQKFPSSKSQNSRSTKQEKAEKSTSPRLNTCQQATRIKEENKEDKDFIMNDFVLNEDFFSGLEDFDEFVREVPIGQASSQQFSVRSCSWF